jgi:site-specific DNA recombinase
VRVACYCRYSNPSQDDGLSIPGQHTKHEEEWLRDRAAVPHSITWCDEPAKSAHVETIEARPIFAQMLRDAEAGKYDIVAVWKMDRFSRRLHVTTTALERLQAAGVGFYSLVERFDLTTPAGWLQAHLMGVLADYYSRTMVVDIKRGKDERARMGFPSSRAPFGYVSSGRMDPPVPDQREDGSGAWDALQLLFALSAEGLTDEQVSDKLNADGRWHLTAPGPLGTEPRRFTRSAVYQIRRNRFYCQYAPGYMQGTIIHNGVPHPGQHIAAINLERWQALQEMARHRRIGRYRQSAPPPTLPFTAEFRSLAVCAECGGTLNTTRTTHLCRDGSLSNYETYRCQARHRRVDCRLDGGWAHVDDVRKLWVEWLEQHLVMPTSLSLEDRIRSRALELDEQAADGDPTRDEVARMREIERWRARREAARTQYEDGERPRDWWYARRDEADAALRRLEAARMPVEVQVVRLLDAAHMVVDLHFLWPRMVTEERIQMATQLIEPRGLRVRPLARGRQGNRWHPRTGLSCELVEVRLREPFREVLTVMADA